MKMTVRLCALATLALLLPGAVFASREEELARKHALEAYQNLMKISWMTNKTKRLKDLEQLGALVLIAALKDIEETHPVRAVKEQAQSVRKSLEDRYKTNQAPDNVMKAYQWIIGKGPDFTDPEKFGDQKSRHADFPSKKLDEDLDMLRADYAEILQVIRLVLKKETMLPSLDEMKYLYKEKVLSPMEEPGIAAGEGECNICFEYRRLFRPTAKCTCTFRICSDCRKALAARKKTTCPQCNR